MKSFNLRMRAPTIKFMKGKGKEMIEEWSNERSDSLIIEDRVIDNPNAKSYDQKPIS